MLRNVYQTLVKPVLFKLDSEKVHVSTVRFGEILGTNERIKEILTDIYSQKKPSLSQNIAGINFSSPVGLSAGFDYEARLTQILAPLGFGFQSVGTITNLPFAGNPRPILGRLPISKSLIVNKGFKNLGADETIKRLSGKKFPIPVGISIGRTNSKDIATQSASIADIISAFVKFETAKLPNSYYELNISCPNLFGSVSFYPPKNLHELLTEIDKLRIKKPIFVKMPISESCSEIAKMIEIITFHSPVGIIIGNLQKDRSTINPDEAKKIENLKGGLSGKPTLKRSNELISLAYKNFGKRLIIIGCGGVFNAQDAFEKIIRGASLVQLITGMVFEGPQLISEINAGLAQKLKKEGFKNIARAVGSKNK